MCQGQKSNIWGMVIRVDDHPLPSGSDGGLDPNTYKCYNLNNLESIVIALNRYFPNKKTHHLSPTTFILGSYFTHILGILKSQKTLPFSTIPKKPRHSGPPLPAGAAPTPWTAARARGAVVAVLWRKDRCPSDAPCKGGRCF